MDSGESSSSESAESDGCNDDDNDANNSNNNATDISDNDDGSDTEEVSDADYPRQDNQMESSSSSDSDSSERCAICLLAIKNQEIGSPDVCDHLYCFECINEWARNINTCPIDRLVFNTILSRDNVHSKKVRRISIQMRNNPLEEPNEIDEEITFCEVCHNSDREDRMLLCDGCNNGYHLDCLDPPLHAVPHEDWFCPACDRPVIPRPQNERLIARTRIGERVRERVRRNRQLRQVDAVVEEDFVLRIPAKRRKISRKKYKKRRKSSSKYKSKKEKSTDCDSALIPLRCVHG